MKKTLALLLAVLMVVSVFAGCAPKEPVATDPTDGTTPATSGSTPVDANAIDYTYNSYSTALGNNWNPHTWETNADDTILTYLSTPLASMVAMDTVNGVYQWTFLAATDVVDVTAEHQDDLTKYPVKLPEGATADTITEGYVYEIRLNPDMKWEDGTPITADDYIYSMQQLLNPDMQNYRSNLYWSGESAVAGGNAYYNANKETVYKDLASLGYASVADALAAGQTVLIDVWDFYGASGYTDADGNECPQYVSVTDETVYDREAKDDAFSGAAIWEGYQAYLEVGCDYASDVVIGVANENYGATFDVVGCYKVDDYTIRYVNEAYIERNYFLGSMTSNWLVNEDLYEAGKETSGSLVTTNYNSTKDTTMSYGPYKIESLQDGKQIVFVQNENWYGYQKDENGKLYALTPYEVDGEHVTWYQTQKIVIDVMTDDAAKQAFLKGELNAWTPPTDEVVNYASSEQMYKVDESYTMAFFFNTGVEALQEMDRSKGNTNSVVLSNESFRKAFSLAIDRADWVTATAGYKPAYSLMNSQYYYDFYNNPDSSYRSSDEAMQAICNLYEVEYGEGTPYATLKDAYDSITGYNLTEAKELMKTACDELVAAGLYTAGDPIHIRIGYKKGTLDSSDQNQMTKMNTYINAAAEGSGFGTITLEAIDNVNDRYGDVGKGEFAIGYGAWGGAQLYPFRNFLVYCDNSQVAGGINESGCWTPESTNLTLNVNGEDVTMTWTEWSNSMVGVGRFATEDNTVKLGITAAMEEGLLKMYYRIPLATTCATSLLSYQCSYYTEEYNLAYGFGGLELMTYNYTDAEWAEYVASQGGTLSYE